MNLIRKSTVLSLGILILISYFYFRKDQNKESIETDDSLTISEKKTSQKDRSAQLKPSEKPLKFTSPKVEIHQISSTELNKNSTQKALVKPEVKVQHFVSYTIDDGVAVTQRDMVIGEIKPDALLKELSGRVPEPEVNIWPTNEIPFFIQPDVPNKSRVTQALQMFASTNVRFVSYTNQEDAIVFERRGGACKSYVGYIGGLQKIFLADGCGPTEIAHEIMHSLGFVHEQNRADRDQSIQILWDNVDLNQKINFEKFSSHVTRVSSAAPFDFESIMIYPDRMFSRNSQPTMKPLIENQIIAPRSELSAKDIERINSIY